MTKSAEQAVSEAIDYIAAHWQDQPDLDFLARRAGYDPAHFQKTFSTMVGLSPKKLVQFMSARYAKDMMLQGYSTLDAAYAAGLSGNGRLHDLFITTQAATPGEVKQQGKGVVIRYAYHPTPVGDVLIGQTDKGLCWLGFVVDGDRAPALNRMFKTWAQAEFVEDVASTHDTARKITAIWNGQTPAEKLPLHLYGTNFQVQVWQALMKIPCGSAVSYQSVAQYIGKPKASRAVGSAVGANPISLLIPCHRVIQASGIVENYGWGTPRKKLILALEGENITH